jgi:hypothetical protein
MKFYLSLALAAIIITSTAYSQRVNFGIKGGLTVSNIQNENDIAYNASIGFHTGILAHIHLTKQFALQPELVFSTSGAKYSNFIEGNANLKLGYIQMPILFQYMFSNGFRLEAGPQLSFLMYANKETSNFRKVDFKNDLRPVDLGLAAGVGYVFPKSGFGIDTRVNLGLANINENANFRSYNRTFQMGVFYLFNHK